MYLTNVQMSIRGDDSAAFNDHVLLRKHAIDHAPRLRVC